MKIYEIITEAFDNPYPINWFQKTQEVWEGSAQLPDGSKLFIDITESDEGYYAIEFAKSDTQGKGATMKATGTGDEFRIFATVQAGILEWWKSVDEDDVQKITFNASKQADDSKNRYKLYARFAKQWANKIGWVATSREEDGSISFVLIKPAAAKFAKDQDLEVMEGVNDPHIFKAVFLAGGPGSGKSFVAKNILGGTGLKAMNSDDVYETLMKKQDLALDPDTIASPQGQEIRDKAKLMTKKRSANWIDGRLGLLIDGTGKDVARYRGIEQKLKAIGYDTSMIYVNTSLEVAQQRNLERERSLKPEAVEEMWNYVQQNLMQFQQMFGTGRFHIIDNSGGLEDPDRQKNFNKVYVEMQKFLNTPPRHRKALAWISQFNKS